MSMKFLSLAFLYDIIQPVVNKTVRGISVFPLRFRYTAVLLILENMCLPGGLMEQLGLVYVCVEAGGRNILPF